MIIEVIGLNNTVVEGSVKESLIKTVLSLEIVDYVKIPIISDTASAFIVSEDSEIPFTPIKCRVFRVKRFVDRIVLQEVKE